MKVNGVARFWDDGFGPLWVYRETLGPLGVVRARTWEDAFQCVQDEIRDGVTFAEMCEQIGETPEAVQAEIERNDGRLPEGFEYRGSGEPSSEWCTGEIASEDPNGSSLDLLTPELAAELGIGVEIEFRDEPLEGWPVPRFPFRVTWEIDVDAESYEAAAREALRIQRDPESIATVFEVGSLCDPDEHDTTTVDLRGANASPPVEWCETCESWEIPDYHDGPFARCPNCERYTREEKQRAS